jgi:hypothetical protein
VRAWRRRRLRRPRRLGRPRLRTLGQRPLGTTLGWRTVGGAIRAASRTRPGCCRPGP